MTFDPAWEAEHAARAWGRQPHPATVEFVGRNYGDITRGNGSRPHTKALDIGAGIGAVSLFLADENFDVLAIEASPSAVDRLRARVAERLLHLVDCVEIINIDVAHFDPASGLFDAIFDVCCLSCLHLDQAEHVIMKAQGWLKPGGRMLSVMAADDCDPAIHGDFKVRQIDRTGIDFLFGGFRDIFVGKHTRLTRRGFISEWVVEVQK